MANNGKKCTFFPNCYINFGKNNVTVSTDPATGFVADKCVLGAQAVTGASIRYSCYTLGEPSVFEECCRENKDNQLCQQYYALAQDTECADLDIFYSSDLWKTQLFNLCDVKDPNDVYGTCANNCPGVEASDIVVGGSAILATTALASTAVFSPPALLYVLGAAGVGAGGLITAQQLCSGPLFCRSSQGTCCLLVPTNQGLRCPDRC